MAKKKMTFDDLNTQLTKIAMKFGIYKDKEPLAIAHYAAKLAQYGCPAEMIEGLDILQVKAFIVAETYTRMEGDGFLIKFVKDLNGPEDTAFSARCFMGACVGAVRTAERLREDMKRQKAS